MRFYKQEICVRMRAMQQILQVVVNLKSNILHSTLQKYLHPAEFFDQLQMQYQVVKMKKWPNF